MSDSPYPPISDYALLSDCHSGALVSKDGSIDWCAFHRFEARPVFARILDWGKGGFFRVAPADDYEVTRQYVPNTNVLETRFETSSGVVTVTDCLVVRVEEGHPDHRLVRRVQCLQGEVPVKVKFEPRFDYGLTEPRVEVEDEELAIAYGGPDALILQTELPIGTAEISACDAARTLKEGDDALIALTWQLPQELEPAKLPRERILGELEGTIGYWQAWTERCTYQGPYRDEVVRSALVLKGLTNSPTGAIVAAPTTSLPEEIGGERNWDYRYSWLRDSALTLNALFALGYTDEAHGYMTWLKRTTAGSATSLQIMYGAGGERFLPEVELDHLEGYRGSRPVRVGNDAASSSSSTSTASSSTRRGTTSGTAARSTTSSGTSSAGSARPSANAGRSRTGASGRSAASRGTSCTRRSWPGSRSTGCSSSSRPMAARVTSTLGGMGASRSEASSRVRGSIPRRRRSASSSETKADLTLRT